MSEAIARSAIGVGWSRALLAVASAVIVACSASCLRQAEGRTQKDLSVGRATSADLTLEVDGGLARIRQLDPGQITLLGAKPRCHGTRWGRARGRRRMADRRRECPARCGGCG